MKTLLITYVILVNLTGFILMGLDKRRAVRNRWRISEKTLFLTAAFFGSIGILVGMYLFRHKTKHLSFRIGIPAILILQLAALLSLYFWNEHRLSRPSRTVQYELNLIRELDADTIQPFISYENLLNTSLASSGTDTDAARAVRLFFEDFRYQIESEEINGSQAVVTVSIRNLDAQALAEDLCESILRESVAIFPDSAASTSADYYQLLYETLSQNHYPTVTSQAVFHLEKTETGWTILTDETLEDALVGGFISSMNNPYILSASTVLGLHLDALKALSADQWMSYLDIEDVFATYNTEYYAQIDEAYITQLSEAFDYEILRCTETGSSANAVVRLTSIDMTNVLSIYKEQLLQYAATTRSIRDDDASFSNETASLLLQALQENTETASIDVELHFSNNGSAWEIYFDSDFTDALMGGMNRALESFTEAAAGSSQEVSAD